MQETLRIDFLNNVVFLLPDCFSIEVKRYIASQFALESAFGSSPFALCNHNFSGMKVPSMRVSLARNLDEFGEFAVYSGLTYCVHDYLLWLQFCKFSKRERFDLDLFIKHLAVSGYCPEPDYIERITLIYNQYYGRKN